MCLIVFSYKTHPVYSLILAANRDELYTRPTRKAQFWDEDPSILAGKDLKGGGTWLGVSRSGKIAALTNYRDLKTIKENAPTRGKIVKDFLITGDSTESYLQDLSRRGSRYNGFNLIAGTPENLFYYNNQDHVIASIQNGNHAISNAFLDTPWPKTETAIQEFEQTVESSSPGEEELFEMLRNTKQYPLEELPKTGLPENMEQAVSSIFIKTPGYGTRCSTIIFVDYHGKLTFLERSYQAGTNEPDSTVRYTLQL
ncbi:MAG: NRDE family protein [Balneolaceae bacterium]